MRHIKLRLICFCPFLGPTIAFQTGSSGDQFDKLSMLYRKAQADENKMAQTSQSGNVFVDILNNHGDTLQQLALLAYLSKGDEAKPFLQATTAAKVNIDKSKCITK